jgi:hypothetical protein
LALTGRDFFFEPTYTTGVQAGTVKVKVRNPGQILHNFSVSDQGIDKDVDKGQTVEIEVKVGGPVRYVCKCPTRRERRLRPRSSGPVGPRRPWSGSS